MLWWRMFHDNQDPLCFILEQDDMVVDNDTKERLKAEVSFGKIVESDIVSQTSTNEAGLIVARLVNKMVNLDPGTRVLQTVELLKSYDFIDVEIVRQHYETLDFRVDRDTDEKPSTKVLDVQQTAPDSVSTTFKKTVSIDIVR